MPSQGELGCDLVGQLGADARIDELHHPDIEAPRISELPLERRHRDEAHAPVELAERTDQQPDREVVVRVIVESGEQTTAERVAEFGSGLTPAPHEAAAHDPPMVVDVVSHDAGEHSAVDAVPLVVVRGPPAAREIVGVKGVISEHDERRLLAPGEAMTEADERGIPRDLGIATVVHFCRELMSILGHRERARALQVGVEDGRNVDRLGERGTRTEQTQHQARQESGATGCDRIRRRMDHDSTSFSDHTHSEIDALAKK